MNNSKFSNITAFHGFYDSVYLDSKGRTGTITGERHIVTQTRTLRYRFYPHFHPYVRALGKRLIEGSVAGLQSADTDYVQKNSDRTFATLPDSFQIALPIGLVVDLPKPGEPGQLETVTLPGSITVTLNTAQVTLADGNMATLPGNVIAREQERGVRLALDGSVSADLPIGTEVTLAAALAVTLPEAILITGEDGKLRRLTESAEVSLPAGTPIKLLGGKLRPTLYQDIFSDTLYAPTDLVQHPYPVRDLDFTSSGAYAVYNWELFYHVPLTIAIHLSKNQRYEEAQHWFHYIFDPTDSSEGATPDRFWKVKPFQYTAVKQIEEILVNLSSGADSLLKQETINSIGAWKDDPFRPHLIARYRQTPFMYKAVMAYLDNLIDWGDNLFRQDTGETINEATQLYVLAALILGERPQAVPKKGSLAPLTYASRRDKWDEFDNTLEKLESEIAFDLAPFPLSGGADDKFAALRSIGTALYFCVPRNDKLMSYWDTVADRLFKVRNSLNLQGIFRQLPLFEPPIDPALLARAAAAGLDIGAVVAGINQPLPLVRFQLLAQKASEICQEVKSLGNNLLSAIEKEDNEALAILRARHEKVILGLAETVKYAQWQETIKNREGLELSLENGVQRYVYYERMLGKQEGDIAIPELDALDDDSLKKFKFKSAEPDIKRRPIGVDISQDLSDSGGKIVSSYEAEELDKLSTAHPWKEIARGATALSGVFAMVPDFKFNLHFWGLGGTVEHGGRKFAQAALVAAAIADIISDQYTYEAGRAAKIGGYARREQEWAFQSSTIAGEINQMFKQLRAAQIRESIAEREWHNHQQQMQHAQEIEHFLTNEKNGKKSNQAFYAWLKREVRGMYGQVFQFAYDVSKKAERALQHELGKPELTFLQFGYMGGKEGLLAGEKLYFDLKRMEMAYLELNQREYELTKHVSLLQLDPMAMLQLRTTGKCTVALPEALFDMDGPGHYFRRIKNVAVSIPCVTGPYTSVNCTLQLTKSAIRKEVGVGDGYARLGLEDSRFSDHYGSLQAIVTSSAQNDSGLFETNLRDERYLPFENSGVISEWNISLPNEVRQFDHDTISDLILHIRYTAREGGGLLRDGAIVNLQTLIGEATAPGSVRLFSIMHEFPSEWAQFQNQTPAANHSFALPLMIRAEHYPFWSQAHLQRVERVDVLVRSSAEITLSDKADKADPSRKQDSLIKDKALGDLLVGKLTTIAVPEKPMAEKAGEAWLTLFFDLADVKTVGDVWVAVQWGK